MPISRLGQGFAGLLLLGAALSPVMAAESVVTSSGTVGATEQPQLQLAPEDTEDGDGSAQGNVTPVPSAELIPALYAVCTDVASGAAGSADRAGAAGWVFHDDEVDTPLRTIYAAGKQVDGYDDPELWSSVETYPGGRLGYCRISLGDFDNHIDFADFGKIAGLTGSVVEEDGAVYGSWEQADHNTRVIASAAEGEVEIEFNLVLPPAAPAN